MIRTVVTPERREISIQVPETYIGKAVEVIAFTIDETTGESNVKSKKSAASYRGILTKKEAEQFHQYLNQARNEWNRNI